MGKQDYIELTYSTSRLPSSDYPTQLSLWLAANVFKDRGRLLDVGCGRCEYLHAFTNLGFETVGVDNAESARKTAGDLLVEIIDIEKQPLPFGTDDFDCVYSKSVIEHLRRPDGMLQECLRVLRPGGVAAIMTPSWRHQSHIFYEDYTHVSPFTANGLYDAMTLAGFRNVRVKVFWQLPFLWRRPWLYILIRMIGMLPVKYRPSVGSGDMAREAEQADPIFQGGDVAWCRREAR